MDLERISIQIRRVNRGNKMLAMATIEFGDLEANGFRISGFKILRADFKFKDFTDHEGNPIWVAPPSYVDSATGKYHDIIFMAKPMWESLVAMIIEEYLRHEE